MILERSGPLPPSIDGTVLHVVPWRVGQAVEDIANGLPIHKVSRVHDGRSGHQVHRGGHHIEVISHANHVRVGHVGPQYGVREEVCRVDGLGGFGLHFRSLDGLERPFLCSCMTRHASQQHEEHDAFEVIFHLLFRFSKANIRNFCRLTMAFCLIIFAWAVKNSQLVVRSFSPVSPRSPPFVRGRGWVLEGLRQGVSAKTRSRRRCVYSLRAGSTRIQGRQS